MCEHCDVMSDVLTELCGVKVADVIMRRVVPKVHAEESTYARHADQVLIATH